MNRVPSKGWTTSLAVAGLIAAAGIVGVMVVAQRDTGGEIVTGGGAEPVAESKPPVAVSEQASPAIAASKPEAEPEAEIPADSPSAPAAEPAVTETGAEADEEGAAEAVAEMQATPPRGPEGGAGARGDPMAPTVAPAADVGVEGSGGGAKTDFADAMGTVPADGAEPPAAGTETATVAAEDAPSPVPPVEHAEAPVEEPSRANGERLRETTPDVAETAAGISRDDSAADEGDRMAAGVADEAEAMDVADASPADQPEAPSPSFDVVRVGPDGGAVFAGRAEPGANVSVNAGDHVIGEAVADRRGEWVILPDAPLEPGSRELGIVSELSGQTPVASKDVVVMVVPERQQTEANVTGAAPVIAVEVPRDGTGPSRLLQFGGPERGLEGAAGLTLETIDYDESGRLDFSGKAQPHSTIDAYLDNKFIGRAQTAENGRWRIRPMEAIPAGMHQLRVDQIDTNGKVISRIETPFSQADMARPIPREGVVIVQPGNSLWRIARNVYGKGVQYTLIYDANAYQIGDPDLIYPGQVFVLPDQEG